jgi:pimeloyl-ACP methyl ester carboxylesterase
VALNASAFAAMAVDFRLVAGWLRTRADTLAELGTRLEQGWSGPAARAARTRGSELCRWLLDASAVASRCDQLLTDLAQRLVRIEERPTLGAATTAATTAATAATAAAEEADHRVAGELREMVVLIANGDVAVSGLGNEPRTGTCIDTDVGTGIGTGGTGVGTGVGAWPGRTPGDVAAWWEALPDAQRWSRLTGAPVGVAALDGIPIADRDIANQLLLNSQRDRLLARRAAVASQPMGGEPARIDAQLRGIEAIERRLRDPVLPRAYLLELSTVEDGQAVIAVGDPDQATDVLTYIPGAGSKLSDVDKLIDRIDALGEAEVRVAPDHQVSVVAWLGYDAPDGVEAVSPAAAHNAEPALDRFADGLRATHDGGRSHNTVLGHSYGSLVAGVTARDRGLDTDDLVFVGSPGVGVNHADDLGLTPDNVWSSTAANDPIQRFAPGWGQFVRDLVTDELHPFSAWYGDNDPDLFLWHGLNPTAPAFGGHTFPSDPLGGHNGYWRDPSLTAIAHIAVDEPLPKTLAP